MSLFSPRSPRPRRAFKRPLHQRTAVRLGVATAGAGFLVAAVAGSMLQFSFAGASDDELPHAAAVSTAPTGPATPEVHQPTPEPTRTAAFETCKEVRDAGADPLRRGDPGYGPHLDRNGNGLACEPE